MYVLWTLILFIYNNIKIYDCFHLAWIFKRSVWYFKPCQFLQYEYQFKSTNYLYCVIQVWIQNCKNLEKIIYTVISVMYKGLYHAFGTQILRYIIPVSFNTKCVQYIQLNVFDDSLSGYILQKPLPEKNVLHDICYLLIWHCFSS